MSMFPSNINSIVDSISRSGLAFSNRYEVTFEVPAGFIKGDRQTMENLTVRCDNITIPGRSFSTTPYRFYGPARNMPYEPIYSGELTASIVLSSDMRERQFFEDWMDLICSKSNYKFEYYENYVTTLEIKVMTKDDMPSYRVFVEEAYPKMMGDVQVGYDKENDYLKQDITLSFRKYTPEYLGMPQPQNQGNRTINELLSQNSNQYTNIGGSVYSVNPLGNLSKFDPQTAQPLFRNQRGFNSNRKP
jgi:hypothetical protein